MTKAEAIHALHAGDKITHRYFTPEEYVCIDEASGHLIDEKGYQLNPVEFWDLRSDNGAFDNGWEIFIANN